MAQRIFSILVMVLLTIGFSFFARANESLAPLDDQPFHMLTYDQFRRLNDQNQMAYLNDLREMLVELDTRGVNIADLLLQLQESVSSSGWAYLLSALNQPAQAADSSWCDNYNFTYNPSKGQYCVATNNMIGGLFTRCGDTANSYLKSCPTKFNQVRAQAEERMAGAEATKLNTESDAVKKQIDSYQDQKYGDQSMTNRGPDTLHYKSTSDAKTDFDKAPKKFRCIYAGFTVYGDKCAAPEKYVDPKTNTVYTCKAPSAGDKQDLGVVAPAKPDSKKTILCNPVFFGTLPAKADKSAKTSTAPAAPAASPASSASPAEKVEPICVARGKNATAACLKAANSNKEASLKSAVKFAKDNKEKYDELNNTIAKLCSENGPVDVEMSDSSKKDLTATCQKYRDRLADYQTEYGKSNSGGGIGSK